MKSVVNAAVRRQLEATAERMGAQALEEASQGIKLRTEKDLAAASSISATNTTGQPLAHYIAAQKIGNTLYMSGVIAVDAQAGQVLTRYDQLDSQARAQLRQLGYDTGQLSVDIFEAPIVVQSYTVLQRVLQLALEHDMSPQSGDMVRLVQFFRDLRHYPAYNRVRSLLFAQGVVSTVVEVSRMLPSDEVLIEVEATIVRA
jgi:enamine deaminase RidA (YjgF/YER057c/UK114 family)